MRKVVVFSGLAALALFAARQLSVVLAGSPHLGASQMLLAGGVFTLAIAVLIRE